MTTHAQARSLAERAFRAALARSPTLPEVQHLQGIGLLETSYGDGWKLPAAVGAHNIGAVIAGDMWHGETFEHRDSKPVDGSNENEWYVTKFRKYPTALDGWTDLVRIMYQRRPLVLAAATHGDTYGVSAALYSTKYFFGFGPTSEVRIKRHFEKLSRLLGEICRSLNEPLPGGAIVPQRTLQLGVEPGDDVRYLQQFLGGLVADGIFGAATWARVVEWQRANGIKPDGIVGPLTWAKVDVLDRS